MPFKITNPVHQTFELERTDKNYGNDGEPTTVTIRQARQHQHALRQDQWNKFERRYSNMNPDEITITQELSFEGIKMLEAWMVIVDSNMLAEGGKKVLFPSKKGKNDQPVLAMKKEEFDEAWGALPTDVCAEIHEKILEVNPIWAGSRGE